METAEYNLQLLLNSPDSPSICGICLEIGNLLPFDEQYNLELFETITSIDIQTRENLPKKTKNVCSKCSNQLEDISLFIDKARYNDKILKHVWVNQIGLKESESHEGTNSVSASLPQGVYVKQEVTENLKDTETVSLSLPQIVEETVSLSQEVNETFKDTESVSASLPQEVHVKQEVNETWEDPESDLESLLPAVYVQHEVGETLEESNVLECNLRAECENTIYSGIITRDEAYEKIYSLYNVGDVPVVQQKSEKKVIDVKSTLPKLKLKCKSDNKWINIAHFLGGSRPDSIFNECTNGHLSCTECDDDEDFDTQPPLKKKLDLYHSPVKLNKTEFLLPTSPQKNLKTEVSPVNQKIQEESNINSSQQLVYTCQVCCKTFSKKGYLTKHTKRHTCIPTNTKMELKVNRQIDFGQDTVNSIDGKTRKTVITEYEMEEDLSRGVLNNCQPADQSSALGTFYKRYSCFSDGQGLG